MTGDSFPRLGAWVKLPAPESVELLAIAGFDFVVIDAEHGAIDTRTASTMIGLARGCGLAPFVRVAGTAPRDVHPGPIVLTNLLPTVVFRRIADASDSVRICAISHAEAHTSSIAALIASLRSIVGSLEIDDKLA